METEEVVVPATVVEVYPATVVEVYPATVVDEGGARK